MATEAEILTNAIARCMPAVVSLPSAGLLRHVRSRFLDGAATGIWAEVKVDDLPLIQALMDAGTPVAVSFRHEVQRVQFTSPLLKFEKAYALSGGITVSAVCVSWPEVIKASQRRQDYRVPAVDPEKLSVRVWQIPEHTLLRDKPSGRQELRAQLIDLSQGGLGLILRPRVDGEIARVTGGERLRIELKFGEDTLLLEGRVRHPADSVKGNRIPCGVAFEHQDRDLDGRRTMSTIAKIVAHLQREEVRRTRRA